MGRSQESVWLARQEQEYDNLRAAMSWLLERGEAEMALRLGAALFWFWQESGYYHEGWNFLVSALEGSEKVAMSVRAKALKAAVWLALNVGDIDLVEMLCKESLALSRELGDTAGIADTLLDWDTLPWIEVTMKRLTH